VRRLALCAALGALGGAAFAAPARAGCPSGLPAAGWQGEEVARARTAAIERALARERRKAAWWNGVWIALYAASTTYNTVSAIVTDDDDTRIDSEVQAAKSALALSGALLAPLRVPRPVTAGLTCRDLSISEDALLRGAERERRGRRWVAHLSTVTVNLAASLYLGLVHDHWKAAAISGIGGVAVGEIRIFTQPNALPDVLAGQAPRPSVSLAPLAVDGKLGLGLAGSF
jgi:hypothetical protein